MEKIWHIKGWQEDFDLLKDTAKCTIDIEEDKGKLGRVDATLRFSFKKCEENHANVWHQEWLSLCVSAVYIGRHNQFFSITVDQLDSEFKYSSTLLRSKQVHFAVAHDRKERVLKEMFCPVSTCDDSISRNYRQKQTDYSDFIMKIVVKPLFISPENGVT